MERKPRHFVVNSYSAALHRYVDKTELKELTIFNRFTREDISVNSIKQASQRESKIERICPIALNNIVGRDGSRCDGAYSDFPLVAN